MAKLTLHIPDDLVATAKREAASRRTSVSRLVSDYFAAFRQTGLAREEATVGLDPLTASLLGSIEGSDSDAELYQTYIDHLEQKHS